jgi:cyanophycin synthetase
MAISRRLIDELFPPGISATTPKVAITGTNGKTKAAHIVASILQRAEYSVSLATTNGCFVNGEPVLLGEASYVSGALELLQDKRITAAVLETARGGVAFGPARSAPTAPSTR